MPIAPAQQYLAYIHERHKQLREGDKLPETLEQWNAEKQRIRSRLLESWGGFPQEPCDLAPQHLGGFQRDGYRVEKIIFQTLPGVYMTANAYVPDAPGKHPAVLCVHGHWKGAKQDPVPQSRCIGLAKLGFFVLMVDAFGAGERGIGKALGEYHGEMTGTTLWPIGRPLSGIQVYENMRAVDYLLTRPEVDGAKLGITGASGGGNQTMYAGAFDERFRCVVPVCSVGTFRAYLGVACCVCEVVPDILTYAEEWALLAMVAPRALMVVNATKDGFQFSVGEAQKSVAGAQHVFRLYDAAGKISHTIFESPHDYGKAMREAMYGWMTLHLKGEGQGNPIPEPPLTPEEPEALRCFPGESRPDSFVTLPRFAAREADELIKAHAMAQPGHREHWHTIAMQLRHDLSERVLGGFPNESEVTFTEDTKNTFTLRTETGIEITAVVQPGAAPANRLAVVVDLEGIEQARDAEVTKTLAAAGWNVVLADLRATGRYALQGRVGRAPDHNPAEWAVLTGRPLLGQWAWDVRCLWNWAKKYSRTGKDDVLVGIGAAGPVVLCAAAFESGIPQVALVRPLATFRSDVPYSGQRMGLFAPGILRDVGDVAQMAALIAPRPLHISGAVTPGGDALAEPALARQFEPTRTVYRVLGQEGGLSLAAAESPEALVKRLGR
jgi:dienelactone hydrolase